jgi:hypothetical protein
MDQQLHQKCIILKGVRMDGKRYVTCRIRTCAPEGTASQNKYSFAATYQDRFDANEGQLQQE